MPRQTGDRDAVAAPPEQLQAALLAFLSRYPDPAERLAAIEAVLKSPAGRRWREQLGLWIVWLVPVDQLVPQAYGRWRPLVRDAMRFTVSRLSPGRLAGRIAEQVELPPDTPPEVRLLRLIAKVPGLQKIGQVLARNRNFEPRFRRALSQLENGIADVSVEEIHEIVRRELGQRLERYEVKLAPGIASEATVSAVVRFTWRNPESRRREPGVFKVMKPHIPACYAEDMRILQQLAGFLARKHVRDRSGLAGLTDTFREIRLLLAHEVDFRREQRMLERVRGLYGALPGVRVPRLIGPLSSAAITALTHENGVKATEALPGQRKARAQLARRLAEALLAAPVLTRQQEAIFHGDPHAGNLLYDSRRRQLVILDWALAESLSRDQRRFFAMLVLMTILRDPQGICDAIEHLRLHRTADDHGQARMVRTLVGGFLKGLPLFGTPGAMDAVHLLDLAAKEGIRFPASFAMFRKAAFTLDGVVEDVAGASVRIDSVLQRYALTHLPATVAALWSLFSPGDWIALECSALTLAYRMCAEVLAWPVRWIERGAAGQAIAAEPTSG